MKARLLVIAAILLSGSLLFGQGGYKGSVSAEITTEDGSPLPGAVAELTADTFSRSFVSDANGAVRFVGLVPQVYELRVTFTGFNTYVRPGIIVDTGQNVRLDVVMTPSTQQEEMVVTAESPLMDSTKTGTATVLTEDELNAVPQSRDPWSVIMTVPGVQSDRINVGGSEAGQQSNFASKGDDGDNASWVMDGVEFVDPGSRGASQSYLDFSSFQQMSVTTGGADVSQRSGGAALNFVTKQGSNNHQGSVRLLYADQEFQGDTTIINDVTGAEVERNGIGETFEKSFELGGPLIKDRLWYWGSFSQNTITQLVPTAAGDFQEDRTELRNISFKLHGDITATTRFNAFYTEGDKIKAGRGAGVTRPRNSTWNQGGPTPIYKFEISQLIGQHTELSLLAARVDGKFSLTPIGDPSNQIGRDLTTFIWEDTTFFDYSTRRPTRQYEVKGNTFLSSSTLDHELSYGFQYKEASVSSVTTYGDDSLVYFLRGEQQDRVALYRMGDRNTDLEYTSFSIQDTMTTGNWTFKAGLRYDKQEGNNTASRAVANPLDPAALPEAFVGDAAAPFDWTTIAPRLGATYTFGEDNQYLIRGSVAQFYETLGSGFISPSLVTVPRFSYHNWNRTVEQGGNGDFIVDANEIGDLLSSDVNDPVDRVDGDLDPPETNELILGFEWAVTPEFTVGVSSTIRERDNATWNTLDGAFNTNDHFQIVDQTLDAADNPVTGQSADISYYELSPEGEALIAETGPQTFLTNRPDYTEDYFDIELTATKRLSNRWMLRANLTFIDWSRNVGDGAIQDPTNFQSGFNEDGATLGVQSAGSGNRSNVFFGSSTWSGNINGLYQLPWDLTVSGSLNVREGFAFPYAYRHVYFDGRGRNINFVKIDDFDGTRADDVTVFDFKMTKTFHMGGRTKVEVAAEIFNAFDDDVVLARELNLNSTRATEPVEWLSPRIGRFSATVHF